MGLFDDLIAGMTGQPSYEGLHKLARAKILELEAALVGKDLDLDRLKRKAQYVADLAYNKALTDAKVTIHDDHYWADIEALKKTPRHSEEFKKSV